MKRCPSGKFSFIGHHKGSKPGEVSGMKDGVKCIQWQRPEECEFICFREEQSKGDVERVLKCVGKKSAKIASSNVT